MAPASEQQRVWFITGISRGFGLDLAEAALQRGDVVIGTTRDGESPKALKASSGEVHVLKLDVSHEKDVFRVVEEAHKIKNRLDVVVNNAGYGLLSAVEEISSEEAHACFNVNVFGTLAVIQAVLPLLKQQKSGHIINFSSIAGIRAGPGGSIYSATKHAVEAISEALAQEVAPFSIKVTIVEPGFFRTDFLNHDSMKTASKTLPEYKHIREGFESKNHKQAGDPKKGCQAILKVVDEKEPGLRLFLGPDSYQVVQTKTKQVLDNLERYKKLTMSTDHDDAAQNGK